MHSNAWRRIILTWNIAALVDGEKDYYCLGAEISNNMYWRSRDVKRHHKRTGIKRLQATATPITAL